MLINDFLAYLKYEKRYSPHTLLAYSADLLQFENFLKSESLTSVELVQAADVKNFMVHLLQEKGLTEKAVNRKVSSLKSFYKFLHREDKLITNPTGLIKTLKTPSSLNPFSPICSKMVRSENVMCSTSSCPD